MRKASFLEEKLVKIKRFREGSQVERTHTVRHIGSYSVGEHSHGVSVLLYVLHPDPSSNLLKAAIFHDLHEVHTGDIPVFAKTDDFRSLENSVSDILQTDIPLTKREKEWLRAVDSLDLYLWCLEQKEMGNKNVERIAESVRADIMTSKDCPEVVQRVVTEYSAARSWPIGASFV